LCPDVPRGSITVYGEDDEEEKERIAAPPE
jgi:hypothetical protein